MRRLALLIALAACLAAPAGASAFNAMTWNVGGGYKARHDKGEKPISTFAIARIIAENNAEVVSLQEVCRSQLNAIKKDLDDIAKGLGGQSSGYSFHYAPTISPLKCSRADGGYDKSSFGDAILTRTPYEMTDFAAAELPRRRYADERKGHPLVPFDDEVRKAAAATISVGGRSVRIWSIHTSPHCACPRVEPGQPKKYKDPDYQLRYIHRKLLGTLGRGLPDQLLMGDLNDVPARLREFARAPTLTDVDPGGGATTFGPKAHKIDYIFKSASLTSTAIKVIDPYYHASRWDHKPLWATIELR